MAGLPCPRNVAVSFQSLKQIKGNIQFSYIPGCHSAIGTVAIRCGHSSVFSSSMKAYLPGQSAGSAKRGFLVFATADANKGQSEDLHEVEDKSLKKYTWADPKKPRICILGGGFGGLYTALRLESLVWPADKKPEVLVVDQSDRFVFKPLLYELLSKEVDVWEVAPSFKDLLNGTNISFQQDKVEKIQPFDESSRSHDGSLASQENGGTVLLESGLTIDYDWLVLALGSESKRDIVPGATEYAIPFSSLEDVLEIERQLRKLERERFGSGKPPIRLVVVGAGYCGVELAATLAERLGDRGKMQMVDVAPDICTSAPVGNREAAYKVLSSRGVELILGVFATEIKKVSAEDNASGEQFPYLLELRSANKPSKRSGRPSMTLPADMIFWTVGGKPALPSEISGSKSHPFPMNGRGQVETDDTLRVRGYLQIFAVGDSSFLRDSSNQPLQATAQVAFQQADYCGWNLWAAINNRPLLPFRFQNLGEMMTLGRNDAAVTVSFVDGITLEGPLGHTARKLAYLYRLPTNEHRLKVGLSWFVKSTVDTVATLQDTFTKLAATT
ncbi:hypothetical protein GOP47_0014827 [Adiantum capillus-veneris]|uniref:demethylphylloquinone reductase n=1 Tax=Adiantum capillus-veneris TaxID=13818 RepID=A0A9D4UMU0_ADICA|nr:hypothetical protein GOP47_0014827 [Adiantum capillus-veneris]